MSAVHGGNNCSTEWQGDPDVATPSLNESLLKVTTDVSVTGVSAPGSAVQGDMVVVTVAVKNVGSVDVPDDITVTLTDTSPAGGTAGMVSAPQTIVGGLAAGGSTDLVYSWKTSAASLADQAATSTNTDQYGVILGELVELYAEIDRIGVATSFNGTDVFSVTPTDIFVGDSQSASTISFTTGVLTTAALALTDPPVLASTANALTILTQVELAIDTVAASRGTLGAFANRLENAAGVIQSQIQNLTAAESQIRDANIAEEVANLTKFQILQQTGIASLAQANQSAQSVLALFQ